MSSRRIPGPAGVNDDSLYQSSQSAPMTSDSLLMNPVESMNMLSKSIPWQKLCLAYELSSSTNITDIVKVFPCSIDNILKGRHDLKVDRIAAIVSRVIESFDGWIISFQDYSGLIDGFVSAEESSACFGITTVGSAVVLEKVSVFVTQSPFRRYLNITKRNVILLITPVIRTTQK